MRWTAAGTSSFPATGRTAISWPTATTWVGWWRSCSGRATGVCGGIGGTQHLHSGNLYTNGVQGGIVPNAVGAALAEKLKGTGAIVAVFLGDGTLGQGTVYESLNLAALWSLPVLFVLEDNQYAQSTHRRLEHAGDCPPRRTVRD